MLNWELLKSPINWLTILFMLVLAAMAGVLFMRLAGINPATDATATQ